MADKSDIIYAKAVLDFDKEYSIKQIRDIGKHADKILKNISKTGKNNLTPIDERVGIYGSIVKKNKKYYQMIFSRMGNELKFNKDISGEISKESMKQFFGIDFNKLEDLVSKYSKIYDKAEAFNKLVNEIKSTAKSGELVSLGEIKLAQEQLNNLSPEISGWDKVKGEVDKNAEFLDEYTYRYRNASKKLNEIINETLSPLEKQKLKISALKQELAELEHEFIALSLAGEPVSDLETRIKSLRKEINKLEDKLKPTQIQKLFKTIKRVGFYRIARNLFKIIEHGFMDGINDLVAFDNKANETFSSIARSFDLIRSSTALMVMPLAGVVAPMFEQIAYSVVDFAENISRASSALNNMSEYTRVNKEYMKDLREEANKTTTSFDKFESLNAKNNPFEVATMTQEEMDEAKISSTASALQIITHTLEILWTFLKEIARELKDIWNAIEPNLEPFLNVLRTFIGIIGDIFVWIFKVVATVGKWASENGILEETIWGIIFVIAGLKLAGLISNISSIITKLRTTKVSAMETSLALNKVTQSTSALGVAFKAIGTIGIAVLSYGLFDAILEKAPSAVKALIAVVSAIMAIAGAIALVKTHGNPIALATFAIGVGGVIATVKNMALEIPQYANGGLVDSGSLFIAGEAGAELITTMPSGKTGVTNIAQFKQAMVEALYECSDIFQQTNGNVVLNLDGAEIARSKNFKSELNRTNSGLNLR